MPSLQLGGVRTRTLASLDDSAIEDEAACVFAANGPDARSQLPVWAVRRGRLPDRCVVVTAESDDSITVQVGGTENVVLLQDLVAMGRLFGVGSGAYIDITGLSHHVWASLVRAALATAIPLKVIYAEPTTYRRIDSPSSPTLFHLSDGFRGVSPLPGFARLAGGEEEAVLVTFLGFEGMRARVIAMSLDPVPKVVPVVGLPGFQLDLPNHTVSCNREFLEEVRAFGDIRFCRANCPFRAYQALRDIARDNPGSHIYIAPVGTKPHALGAVLYAIAHPGTTELIYDHPKRSASRTSGIESIHVYHVN